MNIEQIENELAQIKAELITIGPIRPGSLTCQYKNPAEKLGASYQISYTFKMKSKTDYVKMACVEDIAQEIETYKRFKELTERWVELAILNSNLKMKAVKRKRRGE